MYTHYACLIMSFVCVLLITTYMLILQYGWTPLYLASERGYDRVVEVLIAAGADVNFADIVSY